ncbi:MAG: chromosome segregation protein SMC [Candidatus Omnitrophica bacterium]|nr:chromosome segregation protein SMC [Candidatus Omnitrophota bacterium]
MYLKKLEIVGFKSFLSKTICKFESGVTAIVGPNGCGKSNIVDAIKWVFGEQSPKSMRSSVMQDVIFNGTEKKEPVNMAEVSITLSNEDRSLPMDYDEVKITRRLFRSGESEYLLNKTPVRLMDVRSLLMGTGLGTSSYSVIEQGKMDLVLSSKPEERRYVFEEASGITRFKAKKREALLKLERTGENLVRINDIIREVERQIKAIERQARKADRYKSAFEELKTLDVKLAYKRFRELGTDNTSVDIRADDLKKQADILKRELEEFNDSLADERRRFNVLMEDLQAAHGEVVRLASDIDKNTHMASVNRERVSELQKYVERLDWEVEKITERKETVAKRLATLEAQCGNVGAGRRKEEEELSQAEGIVENIASSLQHHKHELKINTEKTVDLVSEETQLSNALIKLNADTQNVVTREKRLRLEKMNVEREKENICGQLRAVEEKTDTVKGELESRQAEFDALTGEIGAKQGRLTVSKDDKVAKENCLHEIRPRIEFLEKLISEREGMKDSVKEVMKLVESCDPRFNGIRGILPEIISVRGGYEESLESVMGDFSQAVVVDTREAADNIIKLLSERSLASVSFIILEELAFSDGAPAVPRGTFDNAASALITEEPYRLALEKILNGIFLATSPEEARGFIKNNPGFHGRIICEKGELIQRGRYRSKNYSSTETVSLFGRREKLQEMQEKERYIKDELSAIEDIIAGLKKWIDDAIIRKTGMEVCLREKQVEFADVSSRMMVIREKSGSLSEELVILTGELEEEAESLRQLDSEKKEAHRRLAEVENENSMIEHSIEVAKSTIQEENGKREELFHRISDIKVRLSATRKEEEHLVENFEREKATYARIDEDVEEKRQGIIESGSRIKTLEDEVRALEAANSESAEMKERKIAEGAEKKGQKDHLAGIISVKEKNTRDKEEMLENVRNNARDFDIKGKELEYKKDALKQKISDSYKVDIASADIEIEETFDPRQAEAKVEELKIRIERMGEVSIGAAQEHKQLEERFSFLTKQRDDLQKGREDILHAITRINRTTRKMFMETFEAIQREFSDYFKMLFNGGKAELILADERNPLECGIDIIVRPPGKKLQNIMLLSGGEKAMTAIALIFAIFKVNPSPFCILDEIDAPLDESNIVRFSNILKEFLKLSQFIIVTHNRMTIQLADVLYGITMEEKGVSKMVSVRFSEEVDIPEDEEIPVAV